MTNQLYSSENRVMHQHFATIQPLGPEADPQLYDLWLNSVRATHNFLTAENITHIGHEVQSAFRAVTLLGIMAADNAPTATGGQRTERIAAFMGISGDCIEMLFVHPHFFRRGYGKALVDCALTKHRVQFVDVNEQNPQATAFYARMGFVPIGRDALDSQGRPFPIVHLRHRSSAGA